jgi:DNA-binding NarL/FixJ family response regulator
MALREVAATAAEAAARARIVAELLDEALVELQGGKSAPGVAPVSSVRSPGEPAVLSAREREVLALVAEGRTNKAIAAALFVSPNTVKTHVTSLLNKLQADTRIQLATMATAQGLHHVPHGGAAESRHDRCHRQRARR